MKLEKIMFLLSLTRDEEVNERIMDFECINDQYVVILSKVNNETQSNDYIRFILKQDNDFVFVTKEYNDVLINKFSINFKEILGNYIAKLESNNDEVILYHFDTDVLKADNVSSANIKNVDVSRKKRR